MTDRLRTVTLCDKILCNQNVVDLKENFIETLAHDLKTPVLAQIRILELMNNGHFGSFNSQQKEILKMTLDSCEYMYEVISTLISTYKMDNEDFKLNYSDFNIIEIVEETLFLVKNFINNNNLKVVIIPKIYSPIICADIIRLQKVIQTLLFNSLNRAFKNSIIKIFITENDETLSVKIQSKSGYINPEKLEKMIKTASTEKFDKIGMGIGLYLAKKIIEKHNGKFIASSNLNQNIILGFEIPIENKNEFSYKNCI